MQIFFSIKINGYWWLKRLDSSSSLISMLCLMLPMRDLALVQVHSLDWSSGVPCTSPVEWVYKARSTHSQLGPCTHLVHHSEQFEPFAMGCEGDGYTHRGGRSSAGWWPHGTQSQPSVCSPRTWVYLSWTSPVAQSGDAALWTRQSGAPPVHGAGPGAGGPSLHTHALLDFLFWLYRCSAAHRLASNRTAHPPSWNWAIPREKSRCPVGNSHKETSARLLVPQAGRPSCTWQIRPLA